jgi:16S rRNA (cytidine1402-2'-O)-methyltransferase
MTGKLYIVSTPIGNLEDITYRAINVLKNVDLILAEDTRVTKKLLIHYAIDKHIMSYHHHSKKEKKLKILSLLNQEKNIALVTDAGTPGISDPGNELIDFLLKENTNLKIIPIPGPSAATAALSVSGFNVNKFIFIGFMPKKKRDKLVRWLIKPEFTFCFYESPYRIIKTLEYLKDKLTDKRRILVARELTKRHETLYRGNINTVIDKLKRDTLKGEIVVVVEG